MQNRLQMSEEARASFEELKELESPKLAKRFSARDADLFWVRLERYYEDGYFPIQDLYADHPDAEHHLKGVWDTVVEAYLNRPEHLRLLDLERQITPDWFERGNVVGYVCYPDLFAGSIEEVRQRADYLHELGITYLHLMSVLEPRPGKSDGGYAVKDYRSVHPKLGTMTELAAFASELSARGVSLCVDLVLNHTAKEHEWAQRAIAGEQEFRDFYYTFPDRAEPDAYEQTLPEIFPDEAPGNFTWVPEMGRWVWTTFYDYQWDLNYRNPAVFRAMLETACFLVDQGIDILRLDAAPFLWKRMGTDCQNQPEVFKIIQALRALLRVVSPGVILKAEAIVPPDALQQYLGVKTTVGKQCELAYNNQLMVLLWSGLATRKATLVTQAAHSGPKLLIGAAPINYVRNHDDIGWAMANEDLVAVGEDPDAHRQFLNKFYTGEFPGSFAKGAYFQSNPKTGDARISGTAASLAGLEKALEDGDESGVEMAIRRLLLLHGLIVGRAGIPLIYMGDEIGLFNDHSYLADPEKALDSRWLHRPRMDWARAARRHEPHTIEGRLFSRLKHMIEVRRANPVFHNFALRQPLWSDNQHVHAHGFRHHEGELLIVANFDERHQSVQAELPSYGGLIGRPRNLLAEDTPLSYRDGRLWLESYELLWLVSEDYEARSANEP